MSAVEYKLNDAVLLTRSRVGVIRYIGPISGKQGTFYGVELTKGEGKHNGSFNSISYFSCPDDRGIFIQYSSILSHMCDTPDSLELKTSSESTLDSPDTDPNDTPTMPSSLSPAAAAVSAATARSRSIRFEDGPEKKSKPVSPLDASHKAMNPNLSRRHGPNSSHQKLFRRTASKRKNGKNGTYVSNRSRGSSNASTVSSPSSASSSASSASNASNASGASSGAFGSSPRHRMDRSQSHGMGSRSLHKPSKSLPMMSGPDAARSRGMSAGGARNGSNATHSKSARNGLLSPGSASNGKLNDWKPPQWMDRVLWEMEHTKFGNDNLSPLTSSKSRYLNQDFCEFERPSFWVHQLSEGSESGIKVNFFDCRGECEGCDGQGKYLISFGSDAVETCDKCGGWGIAGAKVSVYGKRKSNADVGSDVAGGAGGSGGSGGSGIGSFGVLTEAEHKWEDEETYAQRVLKVNRMEKKRIKKNNVPTKDDIMKVLNLFKKEMKLKDILSECYPNKLENGQEIEALLQFNLKIHLKQLEQDTLILKKFDILGNAVYSLATRRRRKSSNKSVAGRSMSKSVSSSVYGSKSSLKGKDEVK